MQPPADWTSVVKIACGNDHALALQQDHAVSAWAFSAFGSAWGQTNLPAGLSNVVAIASGTRHGLALRADGTVLSWGKSVELTHAGEYALAVANAFGSVTSRTATLTVRPLPTGPGSLDIAFDPTAAGTMPGLEGESLPPFVGALASQADGKLLIRGRWDRINGVVRRGLARLNADGTLDPSFQFSCSNDLTVVSLVRQPHGRILTAGTVSDFGRDAGSYLLNPDGTVDSRFQTWVHADQGLPQVAAMLLRSDGQILIGGWFSSVNQIPANAVARLQGEILPVLRALGQSAQGFRVELTGRPEAVSWFEASTNLAHWAVAGCVTNSATGNCEFTDPAASENSWRFFRARPTAH